MRAPDLNLTSMPAAPFAPPTPAQQRGALGWLLAVLAVLTCLVALASGPAWTAQELPETDPFSVLSEPPAPDVCAADIEFAQDTIDREAPLASSASVSAPTPAVDLPAPPTGQPQFHAPPPQRPPRAHA